MTQIRPAPLVWINAFPGSGKFTIASILAHKLMESQCTLVHNHDLIDAVTCPRDHPDYRRLRKEERSKAFAKHVLAVDTMDRYVVFTDSQSNNELDKEVALEYSNVALAAGRPFLPVYLRLSREENVRRVALPSRLTVGARKLVDTDLLLAMRDSCDLFEFSDVVGLHLDVTEVDAEESANKILQFIRQHSD